MTPDDAMMRDVRIVHDQCGSYADWTIVNGVLSYGNRHHDYLLGKSKPNYPVPSTIVHVLDAGLANGLEQRDRKTGELLFKIWDTPMPDGDMFVLNGFYSITYPINEDMDVTDWY